MTMEVSKVLRLPRNMQLIFWQWRKSATRLPLPHKTTFDTWRKTSECHKVPRLPRKTTLQPVLKPSTRRGFAASVIDTATAEESQRIETRHVGASKRAFRARLPPIFRLRSSKINVFPRVFLWTYLKIDVSCEASANFNQMIQNATPATEFAPWHLFAQPWQFDSQKQRNTTRFKCCVCHRKWRWRSPKCCACHEKCNASSENVAIVLGLPLKTTFDVKHVGMSQSAMPATRNEATQRWRTTKMILFAELTIGTIGTATGTSREWLRTVADGWATFGEHSSTPRPPEWNRNPCYALGKKDAL